MLWQPFQKHLARIKVFFLELGEPFVDLELWRRICSEQDPLELVNEATPGHKLVELAVVERYLPSQASLEQDVHTLVLVDHPEEFLSERGVCVKVCDELDALHDA